MSIIPHQKRYLPHEMGTRIHAITLYRSAKDIEFVCRRHKIQKPPSCTGTSVMMVRQNLSLTGRIAPIPYIPEHIPTLSLVFQQRKAPKIQGDIMDSVYGNASYLIAFISLTSLTNLHFLFSTKKALAACKPQELSFSQTFSFLLSNRYRFSHSLAVPALLFPAQCQRLRHLPRAAWQASPPFSGCP